MPGQGGAGSRAAGRVMLADATVAARRFMQDHGFVLAAALSFAFLLCLAPLLLLTISLMGFLLQSDEIAGPVLELATSLVPAYRAEVAAVVTTLTEERRVTGILGGIGVAVFAAQLVSVTRTVLSAVFRVKRGRSLLRGAAFDILAVGVIALLGVALAVAMLVAVALGTLGEPYFAALPLPALAWGRLVALTLMYAALTALLFFMYRTCPNTRVPARAALTATIVVAILWELARWGFAMYLTRVGVYQTLYGSFGAAIATLVWLYWSAVIFVLGAELAAVVTERHALAAATGAGRGRAPRPSGVGEVPM